MKINTSIFFIYLVLSSTITAATEPEHGAANYGTHYYTATISPAQLTSTRTHILLNLPTTTIPATSQGSTTASGTATKPIQLTTPAASATSTITQSPSSTSSPSNWAQHFTTTCSRVFYRAPALVIILGVLLVSFLVMIRDWVLKMVINALARASTFFLAGGILVVSLWLIVLWCQEFSLEGQLGQPTPTIPKVEGIDIRRELGLSAANNYTHSTFTVVWAIITTALATGILALLASARTNTHLTNWYGNQLNGFEQSREITGPAMTDQPTHGVKVSHGNEVHPNQNGNKCGILADQDQSRARACQLEPDQASLTGSAYTYASSTAQSEDRHTTNPPLGPTTSANVPLQASTAPLTIDARVHVAGVPPKEHTQMLKDVQRLHYSLQNSPMKHITLPKFLVHLAQSTPFNPTTPLVEFTHLEVLNDPDNVTPLDADEFDFQIRCFGEGKTPEEIAQLIVAVQHFGEVTNQELEDQAADAWLLAHPGRPGRELQAYLRETRANRVKLPFRKQTLPEELIKNDKLTTHDLYVHFRDGAPRERVMRENLSRELVPLKVKQQLQGDSKYWVQTRRDQVIDEYNKLTRGGQTRCEACSSYVKGRLQDHQCLKSVTALPATRGNIPMLRETIVEMTRDGKPHIRQKTMENIELMIETLQKTINKPRGIPITEVAEILGEGPKVEKVMDVEMSQAPPVHTLSQHEQQLVNIEKLRHQLSLEAKTASLLEAALHDIPPYLAPPLLSPTQVRGNNNLSPDTSQAPPGFIPYPGDLYGQSATSSSQSRSQPPLDDQIPYFEEGELTEGQQLDFLTYMGLMTSPTSKGLVLDSTTTTTSPAY